jgi:hypothetical protein
MEKSQIEDLRQCPTNSRNAQMVALIRSMNQPYPRLCLKCKHPESTAATVTERDISDDDLCADCQNCNYNPGKKSFCKLDWPAMFNKDGYAVECPSFASVANQQRF